MYSLQSFVTFYVHLILFVVIWYIFSRFGILYLEKSGNPGLGIGLGVLVIRWGNDDVDA
jgi:hypothetical protein